MGKRKGRHKAMSERIYAYRDVKLAKRAILAHEETSLESIAARCRVLGVTLTQQKSRWHFQFRHTRGWIVNAYPSTGKVYIDQSVPQPPSFAIPANWTLETLAESILDAVDRANCHHLQN